MLAPWSGQMQLDMMTGTQRFETWLIAGFSAMALFLASLGLYSMLATMVTTRTREIGVRMAIGAARGDVARLILGPRHSIAGRGIGGRERDSSGCAAHSEQQRLGARAFVWRFVGRSSHDCADGCGLWCGCAQWMPDANVAGHAHRSGTRSAR
jgi:hypothetical protein